jgi:hypothetical protein
VVACQSTKCAAVRRNDAQWIAALVLRIVLTIELGGFSRFAHFNCQVVSFVQSRIQLSHGSITTFTINKFYNAELAFEPDVDVRSSEFTLQTSTGIAHWEQQNELEQFCRILRIMLVA